jgi:tRNA pseudouridine13 synthase
MPRIRVVPEDFCVEEVPLYPPCGDGEHTFVRIQKRQRNTDDVVLDLARAAGVRPRDVGYAGRKDREALTTQTLSVPGLDPSAALTLEWPGVRVLEATPHRHKLRVGQLAGNRFQIRVRDLPESQRSEVSERLSALCRTGMPNRFGPQRFGRDGRNVVLGARLLSGAKRAGRGKDRRQARFLISALQSAVFNDVLAARQTPLHVLENGDVAVIHASGGLFVVEDAAHEQPRADAFEISPTGPIFGPRTLQPVEAVAQREAVALAAREVSLDRLDPPPGIRLRGARRALRVQPTEAGSRHTDDGLWLDFTLPAGSYATVLVREVLGVEPDEGAAPGDTSSRAELS